MATTSENEGPGFRVGAELKRQGWSVRKLQKAVKERLPDNAKSTSYTYMFAFIAGTAPPREWIIKAIATELGVRAEWINDGVEPRSIADAAALEEQSSPYTKALSVIFDAERVEDSFLDFDSQVTIGYRVLRFLESTPGGVEAHNEATIRSVARAFNLLIRLPVSILNGGTRDHWVRKDVGIYTALMAQAIEVAIPRDTAGVDPEEFIEVVQRCCGAMLETQEFYSEPDKVPTKHYRRKTDSFGVKVTK